MIRKLLLVLLLVSSSAWSASDFAPAKIPPVSFSLDGVAVSQVLRLVFGEVMKSSYVLDPVVVADQRVVSFRWEASKGDIRPFLVSFLDVLGYSMQSRGGVDFIRVKDEKKEVLIEKQVFIYRPKFRDGSYLVDLLAPLFTGSFTSKRGVQAPDGAKIPLKAAPSGSVASMIERKTDTVIFHGSDVEISQLQKILAQVDVSIGQILVRGALYEVQTSSGEGSAFQLAASLLSGKFGISVGVAGSVLGNTLGLKNTGGALQIDAVLSALSTDSRFKVVSSPSLRVRDGATAKLSVGQEVPVLGALSYPSGAGQAVQSIEYRSSGVIFDLTPQIRDSVVDLNVMQQVSNFISTTNGVNGSPTLTKRELQTSVSMSDGDVIVLGGLNETKEADSVSGLPFFPAFMRSKSQDASKSEILLILQVSRI